MPRRTQVAKKPPKRKRSTSRNPTAEDLLKRCAARKAPRGELTAAEALLHDSTPARVGPLSQPFVHDTTA